MRGETAGDFEVTRPFQDEGETPELLDKFDTIGNKLNAIRTDVAVGGK